MLHFSLFCFVVLFSFDCCRFFSASLENKQDQEYEVSFLFHCDFHDHFGRYNFEIKKYCTVQKKMADRYADDLPQSFARVYVDCTSSRTIRFTAESLKVLIVYLNVPERL